MALAAADALEADEIASKGGGAVFLTDGERLVEVMGLDAQKRFRLADCFGNCDAAPVMITVTRHELVRDWKRVPFKGADG